jgi:hypothetical protein
MDGVILDLGSYVKMLSKKYGYGHENNSGLCINYLSPFISV